MKVTKRLDLALLERQLAAAAVPIAGLGHVGTDQDGDVFTYAGTDPVDLPPEAQPVVDAHVAPPRAIDFGARTEVSGVTRTTDAQPHELLRFPLETQTGYDVQVLVMGVDAGNGQVKKIRADVTMKRLNAGPLAVGATTVTVSHQDPQAAAWALVFGFDANDAVVLVTGAAGRSIDWMATAGVGLFAPGGV